MLRIVQMSTEDTSKMKFKIKVKAVEDPDVVQKVSFFCFTIKIYPIYTRGKKCGIFVIVHFMA